MLDMVMEFAAALPAWCNEDGKPLSWRHFQYGMQHVRRSHARRSLQLSGAMSIAHAKQDDLKQWRREMAFEAGYDD